MKLSSILPHFSIYLTAIKRFDLLSATVASSENTKTSLYRGYNLGVESTTPLHTFIRVHNLGLASQPR